MIFPIINGAPSTLRYEYNRENLLPTARQRRLLLPGYRHTVGGAPMSTSTPKPQFERERLQNVNNTLGLTEGNPQFRREHSKVTRQRLFFIIGARGITGPNAAGLLVDV